MHNDVNDDDDDDDDDTQTHTLSALADSPLHIRSSSFAVSVQFL